MPSIVVVYHSGFGHTRAVAGSVARGASSVRGAHAQLIDTDTLPDPQDGALGPEWDALHDADAIVMGCPTYMGTVSAGFKRFMDASGAVWGAQRWRDKVAAGFTNSAGLSGDKTNTLMTLSVFAAQHSMIWVSQGLMFSDSINRLGSFLGLMTQADDAPPSETPPREDHETAEIFGERIARATLRWARGAEPGSSPAPPPPPR